MSLNPGFVPSLVKSSNQVDIFSKALSIGFFYFCKFYQKLVTKQNFGNFHQTFVMRPIVTVMVTKFL